MADLNLRLRQTIRPEVSQRTLLVGRVKLAQAIEMPESEWAKLLAEVEKDPLFQDLLDARTEGRRIIKYKRMGQTGLSSQFYEMQDADVVGGSGISPETLLDQKKELLALIQKVGQEKFEKFFLYREEGEGLDSIAAQCNLTRTEAQQLQDFIIDMSVQAEFYHPSVLETPNLTKPTLIGRIIANDDGTFSIAYYSPHLARGLYEIDRDALRRWQKSKKLDRKSASRLRRYIGLLELANLKQGAFWRVIEYLLKTQKNYLATQDPTKMAPVSLRKVARDLQFAPSTISRVFGLKSVLLPWDREVMLMHLMPGQRKVVLSVLEKMMTDAKTAQTDAELGLAIKEKFGIEISRRSVTACRHVLLARDKEQKAA